MNRIELSKRGLRGLDINDIFDLVSRTEKQLGVWNGARRSVYKKVGAWIVQQRYLNSFQYLDNFLFLKRHGYARVKLPDFCVDLSGKGALKFIYMYFVSQKLASHTSAQAIRIKNNVRTYYVNASPPFSTKILISKTRTVKDMKNEIHIRSRVETFDTVKVPKILQCHMEYDPPFFCEEIISGRKLDPLRDRSIISKKLCPQLWHTYERFGIEFRKIRDVIDLTNVSETLHDACSMVEWHNSWCDRSTFLSRTFSLLESNFFLPFSIGHGDLSLGNMIMGQDREIYIVDWECAKEMPIAFDLFSILKNIPQSRQYFEPKIEDLISVNNDIPILPFREQCFLSILVRILQWKRSPEYLRIIGARQKGLQKKLFKYFDYANCFI